MGKPAPTEVDRRGMAVIRAMHSKALARDRLRGFVSATNDDLRLRAVLEAVESDDSAVLEAWEEFVWRVAIARRTRERDARQREEREERQRRRGSEEGRRVAEHDRRRLDAGWIGWGPDWAPPPDDEGEDHVTLSHSDQEPWGSLALDQSYWRPDWLDPLRDGDSSGTSRTIPLAGGIQREPTPAPSRWSPPLPVERRRRRADPATGADDGPIFVFDEPPELLHPAEGSSSGTAGASEARPIRVIDLARRSREIADTAAAIRVQRAERAERAVRELAHAEREAGVMGGSGGISGGLGSSGFGAGVMAGSGLGGGMGSGLPGPSSGSGLALTRSRRRSPSPSTGTQSWLEEWQSSQPLLGRRNREDDDGPYTLRRVRRRIGRHDRDSFSNGRDTRRDGIVFPDDVDMSRVLEAGSATVTPARGEGGGGASGGGGGGGDIVQGEGAGDVGHAEGLGGGATAEATEGEEVEEGGEGREGVAGVAGEAETPGRVPRRMRVPLLSASQSDDFVQL